MDLWVGEVDLWRKKWNSVEMGPTVSGQVHGRSPLETSLTPFASSDMQ